MVRCIFAILVLTTALPSLEAQTPSVAEGLPSVSISLPANILSETIQISYFLVGPFGGSGSRTRPRSGLRSYEISALVEGKAATEIRMISELRLEEHGLRIQSHYPGGLKFIAGLLVLHEFLA